MENKHLTCIQCGTEFIFSVEEQERFAVRGFGAPKRCPACRDRKQKLFGDNGESGRRKGPKDWRRKSKTDNYHFYE